MGWASFADADAPTRLEVVDGSLPSPLQDLSNAAVATEQHDTTIKPTDFHGFLEGLKRVSDAARLDKALAMLRDDRFRLFAKVEADHLVGVVKSQSDPKRVYSCRLTVDGAYAYCPQNLNVCGGLRGSPCKHLLVLIVGLTKAGELDPGTAREWTQAARGRRHEFDKDAVR